MIHQSVEAALEGLTARQREVLGLVARGHSSKEIGRALGVSPKTIDRHVEVINQRLGMDSRSASARLYIDWTSAHGEELPLGMAALAISATEPASLVAGGVAADAAKIGWWRLPALGGKRQRRSVVETGFDVLKVSAFGLVAVTALLLLATGLMHYFR